MNEYRGDVWFRRRMKKRRVRLVICNGTRLIISNIFTVFFSIFYSNTLVYRRFFFSTFFNSYPIWFKKKRWQTRVNRKYSIHCHFVFNNKWIFFFFAGRYFYKAHHFHPCRIFWNLINGMKWSMQKYYVQFLYLFFYARKLSAKTEVLANQVYLDVYCG